MANDHTGNHLDIEDTSGAYLGSLLEESKELLAAPKYLKGDVKKEFEKLAKDWKGRVNSRHVALLEEIAVLKSMLIDKKEQIKDDSSHVDGNGRETIDPNLTAFLRLEADLNTKLSILDRQTREDKKLILALFKATSAYQRPELRQEITDYEFGKGT